MPNNGSWQDSSSSTAIDTLVIFAKEEHLKLLQTHTCNTIMCIILLTQDHDDGKYSNN